MSEMQHEYAIIHALAAQRTFFLWRCHRHLIGRGVPIVWQWMTRDHGRQMGFTGISAIMHPCSWISQQKCPIMLLGDSNQKHHPASDMWKGFGHIEREWVSSASGAHLSPTIVCLSWTYVGHYSHAIRPSPSDPPQVGTSEWYLFRKGKQWVIGLIKKRWNGFILWWRIWCCQSSWWTTGQIFDDRILFLTLTSSIGLGLSIQSILMDIFVVSPTSTHWDSADHNPRTVRPWPTLLGRQFNSLSDIIR